MKSLDESPMVVREPLENSRLCGARCDDCGVLSPGIRRRCENCGGNKIRSTELSPHGVLIAGSRVYRPSSRWVGAAEYDLAYIETDDGAKVFGELLGSDDFPSNGTAVEFVPTVVMSKDEEFVVPKWQTLDRINGGK